jgi:hypothetical protein
MPRWHFSKQTTENPGRKYQTPSAILDTASLYGYESAECVFVGALMTGFIGFVGN